MRDRNAPIRVLTVDDSPTIQRLVGKVLDEQGDIESIGAAAHPLEARDKIKALDPDVLILDVEMPHMNGIDFLRKIMALRPLPVLMFSSLTQEGSANAIEALSIGAVECVGKSSQMARDGTLAGLPDLVRMAARAHLRAPGRPVPQAPARGFCNNGRVIVIGASTGGVDALEQVISGFPQSCPPTLITQHMPEEFLRSFARRLNQKVAPRVKIAEHGESLADGHVYIAPGGAHHLALSERNPLRCMLDDQGKVSGHRPSVDVLFRSAVPHASRVIAAILTGMGSDGAQGMRALHGAGARTLAQDEDSSVVFGMPRVALEMGGAERAVPLEQIATALLDLCRRGQKVTQG